MERVVVCKVAVIGELGQFVQNDPMAFNYSPIIIISDIMQYTHLFR